MTMLARYSGPCADESCEFDIEPGEIVVEVGGLTVHQGCKPGGVA